MSRKPIDRPDKQEKPKPKSGTPQEKPKPKPDQNQLPPAAGGRGKRGADKG
ncbi:MAG TPA: hypothetical protein VM537_04825 [Anaerolineae bacterium]|nr:hypothetical protein [Anaerolineae bacterium]